MMEAGTEQFMELALAGRLTPRTLRVLLYLLKKWPLGEPGVTTPQGALAKELELGRDKMNIYIARLKHMGMVRTYADRRQGLFLILFNPEIWQKGPPEAVARQRELWAVSGLPSAP